MQFWLKNFQYGGYFGLERHHKSRKINVLLRLCCSWLISLSSCRWWVKVAHLLPTVFSIKALHLHSALRYHCSLTLKSIVCFCCSVPNINSNHSNHSNPPLIGSALSLYLSLLPYPLAISIGWWVNDALRADQMAYAYVNDALWADQMAYAYVNRN